MARFWKRKLLLAKIETTYGIDPVPTAAANAMMAIDVKIMPMEGQDLDRQLDRVNFGAEPTIPVDLNAKLTFKIELQASGTAGTAPAWGPLLRACAMAQTLVASTSVTYNPITTGQESVAIYMHIDGLRHVLMGARGNAKLLIGASAVPYIEFEFTGLFAQPTDVAMPTGVDFSAFKTPLAGTKVNTPTFTVNAVALILRSLSFNLGNTVEGRYLIGSEEILITDKSEKVEIVVEASLLATFNSFTLAAAQTQMPLVLLHGTVGGSKVQLNVPNMQMLRPGAPENRQGVIERTLMGIPQPTTTGNDQFTLVLT